MHIRIKLRSRGQAGDEYVPFGLLPARHGLWISFAGSICAHAAGLWAGLTLLHSLPVLVTNYDPLPRRDRVVSLDVNPPETHQVMAAAPASGAKPLASQRRDSARPAATASKLGGLTAPAPPALATKQFRMPEQYVLRPVPQTLVQMEIPPTMDLHQQLRVPALVILTEASVRHAPPKPFIAPPRKAAGVPKEVAFDMHTPILEEGAGYAKLPDVMKPVNARLPTPAGTSAPVAGQDPSVKSKQAANVAGKDPSGDVNIISLPDHPIPLASAIVLPPVNQSASSLPGMQGTQDGPGAAGVNGMAPGGAAGVQNSAGAAAGNGDGTLPKSDGASGSGLRLSAGGSPEGRAVGPGRGKEGSGTAESARNAGSRSGVGPGSAGAGSAGAGSGSNGSGAETGSLSKNISPAAVKLSRPRDGQYGVAVVQSASGVPGSAGLLNGRPVFSVYLSIGARKEWILQYCLPVDAAARQARAQVVQLSNVSPVGAPYAFTIVRPAIQLSIGARYGFVHGFVNASGKFEQLAEAGEPVIENVAALLAALEQWEFRPASKDGVPTPVEVLLCIPNPGA